MSQGGHPAKPNMIAVVAARAPMLDAIKTLPAERGALDTAYGRVLRKDVQAVRDRTSSAVSAMDYYTERSVDPPGLLRFANEAAAGGGFEGPCEAGQAIRISTGAAGPDRTDTVVMQEGILHEGDSVRVVASSAGDYIRPFGGDFASGSALPAFRRTPL